MAKLDGEIRTKAELVEALADFDMQQIIECHIRHGDQMPGHACFYCGKDHQLLDDLLFKYGEIEFTE